MNLFILFCHNHSRRAISLSDNVSKYIYQKYQPLNSGKLASYIPQLTKADPN